MFFSPVLLDFTILLQIFCPGFSKEAGFIKSILGPFLFNNGLNDLFYIAESSNVFHFENDATFHACDKDVNSLINRLEKDSYLVIECFENSSMKLNQDKCHLLVSGFKYQNVWAKIEKTKIWESKKQKLLRVEIDRTLSFDEHIASLCKKAGKKYLL